MSSRYPDVEAELIAWCSAQMPGINFEAETDTELQNELPTVRIWMINGTDPDYRLMHPIVDFDTFAESRVEAHDIAYELHELLRFTLAGSIAGGMVVGRVLTKTLPRWLSYENTELYRFQASYRMTVHKNP